MRLRKRLTDEERVALKMSALVSDLRLDIEQVGEYIAQALPYVAYNRLQEIAEAARYHKEEKYNDRNQYTLF